MKLNKVLRFCLLSCVSVFLFAACTKNQSSEATPADYTLGLSTDTVLSITLVKNQAFLYSLGDFGKEDGVAIPIQAQHYRISVAYRDSTGQASKIFYRYTPSANYTGTDKVTLRTLKGSFGGTFWPFVTNIVIRFTITP